MFYTQQKHVFNEQLRMSVESQGASIEDDAICIMHHDSELDYLHWWFKKFFCAKAKIQTRTGAPRWCIMYIMYVLCVLYFFGTDISFGPFLSRFEPRFCWFQIHFDTYGHLLTRLATCWHQEQKLVELNRHRGYTT